MDWLTDSSLIQSFIYELTGQFGVLIGWLINWAIDMTSWLINWLINRLIDDWLNDILIHSFTKKLVSWFFWLIDQLIEYLTWLVD